MGFLSAKYYLCSHCGRPIRVLDRVEKCAYSLEQICSRCNVADRFSSSVSNQIPPEYHEKFRFYTHFIWAILTIAVITLVASAWWNFVGWKAPDLIEILSSAAIAAIKWIIALILVVIFSKLPRLGTWLFYWWITIPANRQRMDEDVRRFKLGNYESKDQWYNKKIAFFKAIKQTQLKPLWILVIAGNFTMLIFFIIIRSQYNFAGSYFSATIGVIFVIVQLANIFTIWTSSAYYCKKTVANQKQRQIIELFSWGYMLFLPITFVMFILGNLIRFELLDDIPQSMAPEFIIIYQILYVFSASLMMGLGIYLLKAKPDFEWYKNEHDAPEITNLL